MPLYEYTCKRCGRRFTWLVGVVASSEPPTCDRCGGQNAERRTASRFARVRSEADAIDALADTDLSGDPDDPATMRKWMREMGGAAGESLGDDFDEYVDSAEAGEEFDDDDE
ncbi:MAG: zinc ribbon domain-containing protein [Capsulimonadaceae bacterium]|nr:zinc ribbon domain-containing protein [Capsulimonadaceae bacterium]